MSDASHIKSVELGHQAICLVLVLEDMGSRHPGRIPGETVRLARTTRTQLREASEALELVLVDLKERTA